MTDGKHEPECNAWCDGDTHYLLAESDEACPECGTPCRVEPHKLHRHYTPLDAARERSSALDVGSLSDFMAFVEREAGGLPYNLDHWLRLYFARLTEPGEGTERHCICQVGGYTDICPIHPDPDAGEGTWPPDCCPGAVTHSPDCPTGINATPTPDTTEPCFCHPGFLHCPDTTEATLRAARFWRHSSQCAWERGGKDSDCSCGLGTFRAALQQPAVEGGPE